jgi:NAD(P)-dependent dehydrogenase (short-subunit alcohol dehydrogenase family)
MKESLAEKTILITGASSGIGKQLAEDIAASGAKVIITGRNVEKLQSVFQSLKGEGHLMTVADLTSDEEIERLVSELPVLNGIVFSAGITGHIPARFIRRQDISKYYRTNYDSVVLLTASLLAKKKIAAEASLVFLSSVATRLPYAGGALYAGTKAALEVFSRTLAVELAPKKIRANCLAPSFVQTDMVSQTESTISKEKMASLEQMHPLGIGMPSDISGAALFLLGNDSRWITGTTITLGGI